MNLKNARQAAFESILAVVEKRQSLATIIDGMRPLVRPQDLALYQALTLGTLRDFAAISALRDTLLNTPLPEDDFPTVIILNLGIYQLLCMDLGDHGVVNETVKLSLKNKRTRMKNLINAILRRVQRERETLKAQLLDKAILNLPAWIARHYPDKAQAIALINRAHAPFTLRVASTMDRADYLAQYPDLKARINPLHPQAITLEKSVAVSQIPQFIDGRLSVQDAAAQWAATLLAPRNDERILDACAAPGGKTGHILELAPRALLIALDHDPKRLKKVQENLARLKLSATLKVADASKLETWWDKQAFDAILLDAPCSGSGVLRRHPDIAFLRTPEDRRTLPKTQYHLLTQLWQTLKDGGRLLYTTCSLQPRENQQLIEHFLAQNANAKLIPLTIPQTIDTGFGNLRLPSLNGDGFFYALITKQAL